MPSMSYMQPDWIVFGVRVSRGVRLFASRQLDAAVVEADYDLPTMSSAYFLMEVAGPVKRNTVFTITAKMRSWVVVDADDYPQAWRRLFQHWSAENPQTAQIEVRREIGS